jgi:cold shock CspA family protein/uncharacterized LabA/DUF88 family protein
MTEIGIFYDGNFFSHVSNYYNYAHPRKARINLAGLHEFVREEVEEAEQVDRRYCQIVDTHYFRGRLSAATASSRQVLFGERQWDEVLMSEGVVAHYQPLVQGPNSRLEEKGVDVALALEAFEAAALKRFDVVVLVTGEGDYVLLVRKLSGLGTRVMPLAWEFNYTDDRGIERVSRVAQRLLDEVTYPVSMHLVVSDKSRRNDQLVSRLFMPKREVGPDSATPGQASGGIAVASSSVTAAPVERRQGAIISLKNGYGFRRSEGLGANVFFHFSALLDRDFNSLQIGQPVTFHVIQAEKGLVGQDIRVEESFGGHAASMG